MEKLFDKYAFNARLMPVFVTILPISAVVVAMFPTELTLMGTLAGAATSLGLPLLLSHLGRDRGKNKETELFSAWGGIPSSLMLSHQHSTLDKNSLVRYRAKICELMKISLPTAEEELKDFEGAMEAYHACGSFLREKTRDTKIYDLLFKENINYGFRRNLWGLRSIGLPIACVSTIICVVILNFNYESGESVIVSLLCTLLSLTLAVIWKFVINEHWVKIPAQAYAERLISSSENIV